MKNALNKALYYLQKQTQSQNYAFWQLLLGFYLFREILSRGMLYSKVILAMDC